MPRRARLLFLSVPGRSVLFIVLWLRRGDLVAELERVRNEVEFFT